MAAPASAGAGAPGGRGGGGLGVAKTRTLVAPVLARLVGVEAVPARGTALGLNSGHSAFPLPTEHQHPFKIPRSVLVVIHTPALEVLLIERADAPGFWQSVTGSLDFEDEPFADAAAREVSEETGLQAHAPGHALSDWGLENVYEIYPAWRHRYAPGVVRNTERLFGLCIPQPVPVRLSPREHTAQLWLPWEAAAERCFSPSNAEAVLWLPRLGAGASGTTSDHRPS